MQLESRSNNRPAVRLALVKQCGHTRHVGTCPVCQRAQLAKWQAQLAQVRPAGYAHAA
jgi:hypothetical protein